MPLQLPHPKRSWKIHRFLPNLATSQRIHTTTHPCWSIRQRPHPIWLYAQRDEQGADGASGAGR